MRFEIKAGGTLLILVGLAGLSGAVFVLGLIAGYEMAHQEQPGNETASAYSAPMPPPIEESAVPAMATPAPSPAVLPAAVASFAPTPAPAMPAVALKPKASPTPQRRSAVPAAASARLPADEEPEGESEEADLDQPPRTLSGAVQKAKPYNVQIEAVMDKQGADGLVRKLQGSGYKSYVVPVDIGGQTWYRVRIGPYGTEAEARTVQFKLQKQYSGAFTTR